MALSKALQISQRGREYFGRRCCFSGMFSYLDQRPSTVLAQRNGGLSGQQMSHGGLSLNGTGPAVSVLLYNAGSSRSLSTSSVSLTAIGNARKHKQIHWSDNLLSKLQNDKPPVWQSGARRDFSWEEPDSDWGDDNAAFVRRAVLTGMGVLTTIGILAYARTWWGGHYEAASAATQLDVGLIIEGLPTFSREEISKHKTKETGIWVSYKNGVYDITEFIQQHPGGNKILLAAGGAVEPFWRLYAIHKENEDVPNLIEGCRIGNVTEPDEVTLIDTSDPYATDPSRSPIFTINSKKPFNAEPPGPMLLDNFATPNELFFVRNHLPVPEVLEKDFKLSVGAEGMRKEISLNLNDMRKKFPKRSVTTTIQCAGNRRAEFSQHKPVNGLHWDASAVSTATWSGASLRDVLKHAGINLDTVDYKHVQFEGLDTDPEGSCYGASVPIEIVRNRQQDVIIAYEMNGKPIPRDHGYPLRIIVPGIVGARQVKWLKRIVLSNEESHSFWQRDDYKSFNPSIDHSTADFSKAVSIQELPVQSTIWEPLNDEALPEDSDDVTVKGYAWSGGGRSISRVDVSADGGLTWRSAELTPTNQNLYRSWAWTLWEADVPLPEGHNGEIQLVCKATDVSYNVQPETVAGIWNIRGVLNNAWHRVTVKAPRSEDEDE